MKIFFSKYFKNQLKKLKKKFPSIKDDVLKKLKGINPSKEIHIGRSIYKVRIKSSDQNKGKSGGFRSYIYIYQGKDLLVPLCIYHKSERVSITENELKYFFDKTIENLIENIQA